jgi:hypothetical protein
MKRRHYTKSSDRSGKYIANSLGVLYLTSTDERIDARKIWLISLEGIIADAVLALLS